MKNVSSWVILGIVVITGLGVVGAVIGSILGRPVDSFSQTLILMFSGALIGLLGGWKIGEEGKAEAKYDAFMLGRTTKENEFNAAYKARLAQQMSEMGAFPKE